MGQVFLTIFQFYIDMIRISYSFIWFSKKSIFSSPTFCHKLQIDHERILPLYESDSAEEFDFLKEKFVKRQYYAREEHRNMLNRVKRGFSKQMSKRVIMPITSIRAVQAFRRTVSRQTSAPTPAQA